jgi:hypothetical protein
MPVVHAELQQQMPVEAFASVASAWIAGSSPAMTKGKKNERKKFGGETPTDAIEYSAMPYGHGRARKRQAHDCRRSTAVLAPRGVFHRKGLSLRPCFLGPGLSE